MNSCQTLRAPIGLKRIHSLTTAMIDDHKACSYSYILSTIVPIFTSLTESVSIYLTYNVEEGYYLPSCVRPICDNLDVIRGASSSAFISAADILSLLLLGTYMSDDFFSNFQSCHWKLITIRKDTSEQNVNLDVTRPTFVKHTLNILTLDTLSGRLSGGSWVALTSFTFM